MIQEVLAGPIGELRLAGASGGVALTTAVAVTALLPGTTRVFLTPRNFGAAGVLVGISLNPWLVVLKTTDNLASDPLDYSENAQDGDTGTDVTLSALDTLANGDFLLIGSHLPFAGVIADIDGANGDANTILVQYWNGSAWTDISATDNTASGGASMATDGTVTWTVPTLWPTDRLTRIYPTLATGVAPRYRDEQMHWTRWSWSVAMDAATTLNSLMSLNRSTARSEWLSGQSLEFAVRRGFKGIGAIAGITSSSTANLVINCAIEQASDGFP